MSPGARSWTLHCGQNFLLPILTERDGHLPLWRKWWQGWYEVRNNVILRDHEDTGAVCYEIRYPPVGHGLFAGWKHRVDNMLFPSKRQIERLTDSHLFTLRTGSYSENREVTRRMPGGLKQSGFYLQREEATLDRVIYLQYQTIRASLCRTHRKGPASFIDCST